MSQWKSSKARRVLAALKRQGWVEKRRVGSHRILGKSNWADFPLQPARKIGRDRTLLVVRR